MIEGGYPGASPKDREFFKLMKSYKLSHAKLAAFSGTRKAGSRVELDYGLNAVIESEVDVAVVYGKAWSLHVEKVLRTTLEENLSMVYDSIAYLRSHGIRVIFDAEHFYQGYLEDPDYATKVLETAVEAGADTLVLCDTNGGMLPGDVYRITRKVVKTYRNRATIGAHMHNDCGCAVANTLEAVRAGARHVQGTVNGLGERTGNADLVQVLPGIVFKLGLRALGSEEKLRSLKKVSRAVYEITGLKPDPRQPYVGDYAFRHKAGAHIDAVLKTPRAYEHLDPEAVGSYRSFEITHLSGSSAVAYVASRLLGRGVRKSEERVKSILAKIKEMEMSGYNLSEAQSTVHLLVLEEYCGPAPRSSLRESLSVLLESLNDSVKGDGADILSFLLNKVSVKVAGTRLPLEVRELTVRKLRDGYRVTVVTDGGDSFQRVSSNLLRAVLEAVEDAVVYEVLKRDCVKVCSNEDNSEGEGGGACGYEE